jgi:hypothetical protein
MEAVFIAAWVGFPVVGLLVGRWWALIVPLLVVPLQFLGTAQGWWGYGLGDAAGPAMILGLAFALMITAAAIAFREILRPREGAGGIPK